MKLLCNRGFWTSGVGTLLLSTLVLWSCQGPAGPEGDSAVLTDTLPPTIEWISPSPGIVLDSAATLEARTFDNKGIYRVTFYIAGFEFPAVLADSAGGVYRYEWLALNYPEGPYPLLARVWDTSRLTGSTPVRMVEVRH